MMLLLSAAGTMSVWLYQRAGARRQAPMQLHWAQIAVGSAWTALYPRLRRPSTGWCAVVESRRWRAGQSCSGNDHRTHLLMKAFGATTVMAESGLFSAQHAKTRS